MADPRDKPRDWARDEAPRRAGVSVFDRLLDDAPERPADPPTTVGERLRRLKESVRRDLETLFNTQAPLEAIDAPQPEIERSLMGYGVPGFHGLDLATAERRRSLARTLGRIVAANEPRLHRVRVEVSEGASGRASAEARMLRLRVRGELVFDEVDEPVAFDTVLDPAVRQFHVEAEREATFARRLGAAREDGAGDRAGDRQ